ncbi:MAG: hypothetical protein F4144_13835 [Acidimicrobiaceae bacterium]|nr:hypothetical protein [Acidimicrobiaceae bacterium]
MTDKHPLDDADLDFGDGEEFEAELDEDFGDDEDFADGEDFTGDEEDFTGDEDGIGDDDDEAELEEEDEDDEDDDVPMPAEDDDDEEVHPSDVEADLEEILRDRIAASDDDEEDEEEEAPGQTKAAASVAPQRSDEWTCNQCFLIVSVSQFGSRANPVCPSGEEPCESIERIQDDLDRRGG